MVSSNASFATVTQADITEKAV